MLIYLDYIHSKNLNIQCRYLIKYKNPFIYIKNISHHPAVKQQHKKTKKIPLE